MTTLDGGANPADGNPAPVNPNDKQQPKENGGNDIQAQFDELKAQFETLKKESAGKDSKILSLITTFYLLQ